MNIITFILCFLYFVLYLLIWEENEYTKLKRKFWNHEEVVQEIITIIIKKNVVKKEWKDIMKKLTTDEFIEKSKEIHGEKYDYSKSIIINGNRKICVICNNHGEFFQNFHAHIRGQGCMKCYNESRSLTTEQFVNKANIIHKNKFDYSQTNYITSHNKVEIICPKHGSFFQTPSIHLGNHGCKRCRSEKISKIFLSNTKEFIKKSRKIYGNKYDYSSVNYINNKIPIIIKCKLHGIFKQSPVNHLRKVDGCPMCSGRGKPLSTEIFIKKSKFVHDEKYDYSKVKYKRWNVPIKIICKKHGIFYQLPNGHLFGNECPKCIGNISKLETDFLDYLKIPNTKENRQVKICRKKVDGYDEKTNTIYEFLGDYWHGNPKKFKIDVINKTCKKKFGELYNSTLNRFTLLKTEGYKVYYIWESDWKLWLKNPIEQIPIKQY